jgi:hypothetical protein
MSKPIKRKQSKPARSRPKTTTKRAKHEKLKLILANSDSKTLAALLRTLQKGKRKVQPDVTLSAFEAGFLAAQLSSSLKPKRRRRKKIELDHILFSLS